MRGKCCWASSGLALLGQVFGVRAIADHAQEELVQVRPGRQDTARFLASSTIFHLNLATRGIQTSQADISKSQVRSAAAPAEGRTIAGRGQRTTTSLASKFAHTPTSEAFSPWPTARGHVARARARARACGRTRTHTHTHTHTSSSKSSNSSRPHACSYQMPGPMPWTDTPAYFRGLQHYLSRSRRCHAASP